MDAFGVLDEVLGDYKNFVNGFLEIKDDQIRGKVEAEIADGLNAVSVRDLVDIQIRALQESGESQVERSGDTGPVELAGFGAGQCHQFRQRSDLQ